MANSHFQHQKNPFMPIQDRIYECLLQEIITLKVKPGERLRETDTADRFEVSRTPVKSALERLTEEGFVVKDQKMLLVAPLNSIDYSYLCDVREMIEGTAAYYAAKQITDRQLDSLKKVVFNYFEVFESNQLDRYETVSHEFHTLVIEASNNPYLIQAYDSIQHKILRYRYYAHETWGGERLYEIIRNDPRAHLSILNAIKAGFSDVARAEMVYNASQMRKFF